MNEFDLIYDAINEYINDENDYDVVCNRDNMTITYSLKGNVSSAIVILYNTKHISCVSGYSDIPINTMNSIVAYMNSRYDETFLSTLNQNGVTVLQIIKPLEWENSQNMAILKENIARAILLSNKDFIAREREIINLYSNL